MVVSGYATREIANNDQRRVNCLMIPEPVKLEDEETVESVETNKYTLKDPPDLRSQFLIDVAIRAAEKKEAQRRKIELKLQKEKEELEKLPDDPLFGKRLHAWVIIIQNAPWCYKPKHQLEDNDSSNPSCDDIKSTVPIVFFIEPSTGYRFEIDNPNYLGIESIWNQYNYYINRQKPITNISNMKFDFQDTNRWEHLLPGEPTELRIERPLPDDIDELTREEEISKEKHLDMPSSWVNQLHISEIDFEERFPNGEKIIHYKRAIYEEFCSYKNVDGLMKRLTLYETLDYENALTKWEWYKNRVDNLKLIKISYETKKVEEYFTKGRSDYLRYYTYNAELIHEKTFIFYHIPRLDSLKKLQVSGTCIREYFHDRKDRLFFREYQFASKGEKRYLAQIKENFNQDFDKDANDDISIRNFNLIQKKIFLQFHYSEDAITASTITFIKPPPPEYGAEVLYNPEGTSGYPAPSAKPRALVATYFLLLEQLKAEEKCKAAFDQRWQDINNMMETRKDELLYPKLLFNVFDPLRNNAARTIHLARLEKLRQRQELVARSEPDFLGPYLIEYVDRKPNFIESQRIFQECLSDIKDEYLAMLNELQRRYDDAINELSDFISTAVKIYTRHRISTLHIKYWQHTMDMKCNNEVTSRLQSMCGILTSDR